MQKSLGCVATVLCVMGIAGEVVAAEYSSSLAPLALSQNLIQGEVTMLIPDMTNGPPQDVPVMIAQANQAQTGGTTIRTLGVCQPAPSEQYTGDNTLSPIISAQNYLASFDPQLSISGPATVTVLQQPTHGILRLVTEADRDTLFDSSATFDSSAAEYAYLPEKGYGKDSATLLVDFGGGVKVKLVYFFQQHEGALGNTGLEDLCEKTGVYWRISSTLDANGNSTITFVEYVSPVSTTPDGILTSDSGQ